MIDLPHDVFERVHQLAADIHRLDDELGSRRLQMFRSWPRGDAASIEDRRRAFATAQRLAAAYREFLAIAGEWDPDLVAPVRPQPAPADYGLLG